MANPVVVEAMRGDLVDRPVYPRSAVKALQALQLVASGAAERLGLSEKEIALACASHSGSEDHVATARTMLAKAGSNEGALESGAHWPLGENEARARSGALHNNCWGKHAGFICLSCAMGVDPKNMSRPIMRRSARSGRRSKP
jgi:L-asparaginase II